MLINRIVKISLCFLISAFLIPDKSELKKIKNTNESANDALLFRAINASKLYCGIEQTDRCDVDCFVVDNDTFRCYIMADSFMSSFNCDEDPVDRGLWCVDQITNF